jgi:hypothetical protein
LCGRWFLVVFYGACGMNAMTDNSRTKKEPLRISFPFLSFFVLLDGCVTPLVISFNDFLVLFLLLFRCLSCILLVYLIALCVINDITLTYQKKSMSPT